MADENIYISSALIYSKPRDKGDIQKIPSRYIHVVCDTDRFYNIY